MTDLFLGVIAIAVLTMAIIQVGVIVFAARAAKRVGDAVNRLQDEMRPIVANLQTMSADAARVTAAAAVQVERAERLMTDLSRRLDETATSLQESILTPAREAVAILQRLRDALSIFGRAPQPRRPAPTEEEDALFIG